MQRPGDEPVRARQVVAPVGRHETLELSIASRWRRAAWRVDNQSELRTVGQSSHLLAHQVHVVHGRLTESTPQRNRRAASEDGRGEQSSQLQPLTRLVPEICLESNRGDSEQYREECQHRQG